MKGVIFERLSLQGRWFHENCSLVRNLPSIF